VPKRTTRGYEVVHGRVVNSMLSGEKWWKRPEGVGNEWRACRGRVALLRSRVMTLGVTCREVSSGALRWLGENNSTERSVGRATSFAMRRVGMRRVAARLVMGGAHA
jgi:hypothetical protein